MYSPKIPERLIPVLYRLAQARGKPMTRLVAEALDTYLAAQAASEEHDGEASSSGDLTPRRLKRVA